MLPLHAHCNKSLPFCLTNVSHGQVIDSYNVCHRESLDRSSYLIQHVPQPLSQEGGYSVRSAAVGVVLLINNFNGETIQYHAIHSKIPHFLQII